MSSTSSDAPSAEILAIGTELLLGDSLDTNSPEIARHLRALGLDIFRTMTVGDNAARIAEAMRQAMARASVVITTGGLGPTVDDPTREAAASALGVELTFRDDLWSQIEERFARFGRTPTENNRRQAFLPLGTEPIANPIGTAPAFRAEAQGRILVCLPGVPAEMRWLMENEVAPFLKRRLSLSTSIYTRVLRVAGVGESWVDERLRDLEEQANPTVGILAHPGRIDIRIATKAADEARAGETIAPVEAEIRRRLDRAIYGADEQTLEEVVLAGLASRGWRLSSVERGTRGALADGLTAGRGVVSVVLPTDDASDLEGRMRALMASEATQAGLALDLTTEGRKHAFRIVFVTPDGRREWSATYGGPPSYAGAWAASIALDHLRRELA